MTANKDLKIGGILLAAGGSSRLGRPKQLLNFEGKTLIRRAAETLADSQCGPVVVVLGAEVEGSTIELSGLPVQICKNQDWAAGMSSSIISGLTQIEDINSDVSAVVITLVDQPQVTTENIDQLVNEFLRSGHSIVAAQYNGTIGVPALFAAGHFDDLLNLRGDKGARDLLRKTKNKAMIKMDEAAYDIDSLEDIP